MHPPFDLNLMTIREVRDPKEMIAQAVVEEQIATKKSKTWVQLAELWLLLPFWALLKRKAPQNAAN